MRNAVEPAPAETLGIMQSFKRIRRQQSLYRKDHELVQPNAVSVEPGPEFRLR
jgi:hypothetical protein